MPAVGAACLAGRCAGTASCENHSNGQSLVCCAQNCTGNQRCSEAANFASCALPSVGQGQGCGASVLCDTGLTCNGTTQTCCVSSCAGACRACNLNGTCGNVTDGQRGGCAANQVCAGGACGECRPTSRRCNGRVAQVCSATGVWTDGTTCPNVCTGEGACTGECSPGSRRCDPASGTPQLCSNAGTWQDQAACAGGTCQSGTCRPSLGQTCAALGPACTTGSCVGGRCCAASCATGCRTDGSCDCPASSTFQGGGCDCNPGRSLCSNGTTSSCVGNVFDFEGGSFQGWLVDTVSVPVPCGDEFQQCAQTFNVLNTAGFAHGGTGYFSVNGTVLAGGVRRLAAALLLCGADGSTTTNLVGQRVSAFMQTGAQFGTPAGTTLSLSLRGRTGPPVTILTVSGATIAGAQNTGWIELSAIIPDSAAARAAVNVYLSLEVPGENQRVAGFQFDDVRIGE